MRCGKRTANGHEVIWTILSLLDDKNYVADTVVVAGKKTFNRTKADGTVNKEGKNEIKSTIMSNVVNVDGEYSVRYDINNGNVTITFSLL